MRAAPSSLRHPRESGDLVVAWEIPALGGMTPRAFDESARNQAAPFHVRSLPSIAPVGRTAW